MTSLEAVLYLRDPEDMSTSALREQILKAWAGFLNDPDQYDDPEHFAAAFGHLLAAYNVLITAKYASAPGKMPPALSGTDAENDWRAFALDGYCATFPNEKDGSEAVPWWPEELDVNFPWPRRVLRELAYLSGYHCGVTTAAQQAAYHARYPEEVAAAKALVTGRTP